MNVASQLDYWFSIVISFRQAKSEKLIQIAIFDGSQCVKQKSLTFVGLFCIVNKIVEKHGNYDINMLQ